MAEVSEVEGHMNGQSAETHIETGFAEGDLGRVQALLFGDHASQSRERVDTLEKALLGAIADLRSDMQRQLGELEIRITNESENRSTAMSNLGSRLDEEVKTLTKTNRSLERDLNKTSEKLTTAIDRSSTMARDALEATRQGLAAEIERAQATLRESNVDRSALAGMMAAVAEQLGEEKPS